MTLGEMLEEVTAVTPAEHTDLIRRFNLHQDRLSRDLQFPQGYTTVVSVTDEFALPADARGDGLLEVRKDDDGHRFRIMNVMEADQEHPGWKDWDTGDTSFIIFDPKLVGGNGLVRPVPLPTTAQAYYLTYLVKPDDMTSLTDQPWNGLIDSYHQVIVYSVLYEVLFESGDKRWEYYYQRMESLKDEMFQALKPRVVYANNPVWNQVNDASA